jgi:hypothetical protein
VGGALFFGKMESDMTQKELTKYLDRFILGKRGEYYILATPNAEFYRKIGGAGYFYRKGDARAALLAKIRQFLDDNFEKGTDITELLATHKEKKDV